MHLAVNAWEIAARPGGPVGMSLAERLEGLRLLRPDWRFSLLAPRGLEAEAWAAWTRREIPSSSGAWGQLVFEQRGAPRAAAGLGADLLYMACAAAPVVSRIPVVADLAESAPPAWRGPVERLRQAAGEAGLHAASILLATDLPAPSASPSRVTRVAPWVGPGFTPQPEPGDADARARYGLRAGYVLVHGASAADVALLMAAWSWVAGSAGQDHPLALLGLDRAATELARRRAAGYGLADSIIEAQPARPADLPAVYRGAAALLSPGWAGDGQALRWALASGVPVAGVATAVAARVLAGAAYLAPERDSRALGAACLTLLVEDEVADRLRRQGVLRAAAYQGSGPLSTFADALAAAAFPGRQPDP